MPLQCQAVFQKQHFYASIFRKKGKTAPHCSLQLFLWGPEEEKHVPKLERIAVKRWVDCEEIQRTDSEILLLAAVGSTFSKSFRGMSSQSTHLLTTILSNLCTFSPLGPPKNSCLLEWGAVLRFYEIRCIKVLRLKNSSPRPWGSVFLQYCRPLQQYLTSLHPSGG